MNAIEKEEYKGLTIKIFQDEDSDGPRQWDNFGKMVCAHPRYNLGDEQMDADDIMAITERPDVLWLPLYLYDHGGITMRTGAFSDPWDSGQVGIIYADREMIFKEYGGKILTKALKAKVYALMESEVKTYDQFLTGQVYGYMLEDESGEHLDSCWGFYGFDYCMAEAKSIADHFAKEMAEEAAINAMPCIMEAQERLQAGAI